MPDWYLYILRCRDGTLYTGITTGVERRLAEHRRGTGAKYLKGRAPLELQLQKKVGDKRLALKVENRVKRLSRAEKEKMISMPGYFEQLVNNTAECTQKAPLPVNIKKGRRPDSIGDAVP
jgi:putative endonuclease